MFNMKIALIFSTNNQYVSMLYTDYYVFGLSGEAVVKVDEVILFAAGPLKIAS